MKIWDATGRRGGHEVQHLLVQFSASSLSVAMRGRGVPKVGLLLGRFTGASTGSLNLLNPSASSSRVSERTIHVRPLNVLWISWQRNAVFKWGVAMHRLLGNLAHPNEEFCDAGMGSFGTQRQLSSQCSQLFVLANEN